MVGGRGGLNTITGSIVAVPGAALPPVPLCQLRLARPLHRPHRGTAGHGKVYNNKMPNWGARERERERARRHWTLPCHCPEQELNS